MPVELVLRTDSIRLHPLEGRHYRNRKSVHEALLKEGMFAAGEDCYRDHSGLCIAAVPVGDHVEVMVVEKPVPDKPMIEKMMDREDRGLFRPAPPTRGSKGSRVQARRRRKLPRRPVQPRNGRPLWTELAVPSESPTSAMPTCREAAIAFGAVLFILGSGAALGAVLAQLISIAVAGTR